MSPCNHQNSRYVKATARKNKKKIVTTNFKQHWKNSHKQIFAVDSDTSDTKNDIDLMMKQAMMTDISLFFTSNNVSLLASESKSFHKMLETAFQMGVQNKQKGAKFKDKIKALNRKNLHDAIESITEKLNELLAECLKQKMNANRSNDNETTVQRGPKGRIIVCVTLLFDHKTFPSSEDAGLTLAIRWINGMDGTIDYLAVPVYLFDKNRYGGKDCKANGTLLIDFINEFFGTIGRDVELCGDQMVVMNNTEALRNILSSNQATKVAAVGMTSCCQHGGANVRKTNPCRMIAETGNEKLFPKNDVAKSYPRNKCM